MSMAAKDCMDNRPPHSPKDKKYGQNGGKQDYAQTIDDDRSRRNLNTVSVNELRMSELADREGSK
jgi:hypothetical protein